jgi:hypothetical protein
MISIDLSGSDIDSLEPPSIATPHFPQAHFERRGRHCNLLGQDSRWAAAVSISVERKASLVRNDVQECVRALAAERLAKSGSNRILMTIALKCTKSAPKENECFQRRNLSKQKLRQKNCRKTLISIRGSRNGLRSGYSWAFNNRIEEEDGCDLFGTFLVRKPC